MAFKLTPGMLLVAMTSLTAGVYGAGHPCRVIFAIVSQKGNSTLSPTFSIRPTTTKRPMTTMLPTTSMLPTTTIRPTTTLRPTTTMRPTTTPGGCDAKYTALTDHHTACLPGGDPSAVSASEQKLIVDTHNAYRSSAGPPAADMVPLTWDSELAMLAQKWADNCVFQHDENVNRQIPGRFKVGQNIALNQNDWSAAIGAWHSEVEDFVYGDEAALPLNVVGHYTAIMWSQTTLVGCGVTTCNGKPQYVCNYGPAGNMQGQQHTPYKAGTEFCEDCPGHCVNNMCDCGGLTCLNGGTLDVATCTCTCAYTSPLYALPDCSLQCSGTDHSSCPTLSCPSYALYCPHKCNVCPV